MSTIAEVATSAGVGVGTVSRVLNDSPGVPPATRQRLLAAIDDLGYRPNPAARALAGGRTGTIGVLAPFFTQPSAVERLRGVAEVLAASGHDLVLLDVASPAQRDAHVRRLLAAGPVDGLLVLSLPLPPRVGREVPLVLVDSRAPGVPSVWVDDVRGGRLAAEHLLALGHRRVGFVGDDPGEGAGFTSSADRLRGFAEALARGGAPLDPALVRLGPHGREEARAMAGALLALPEPPTALFAASDTQALGVREAALAAGLAVPDDVSVVGFDDVEIAAHVGLSTVRQPLHESGQRAAAILLEIAARGAPHRRPGDGTDASMTIELPLRFVARASTAPPGGSRRGGTP